MNDEKKLSIYEAIPAIMREVGGIKKLDAQERKKLNLSLPEGIPYAFRGIDQICQKLQPLMGLYGVCTFPNVLEYSQTEYTRKTKYGDSSWTHEKVFVEYKVTASDGSFIECNVYGYADDNSDKGYNKAMTNSYKNLLLRLFCIGDPADDNFQNLVPEQHPQQQSNKKQQQPQEDVNYFQEIVKKVPNPEDIEQIIKYIVHKKWISEVIPLKNVPEHMTRKIYENLDLVLAKMKELPKEKEVANG